MSVLADLLSGLFDRRRVDPLPVDGDDRRAPSELARALMNAPGEDAQRDLAARLLARYGEQDDAGKRALFLSLARDMDVDRDAVRDAVDAYARAPGRDTYRAFAAAAEPPRQDLIRRINRVTDATGRIVDIRADLRRLIAEGGPDAPALSALDEDFRHLLSSWFNRGFLVLRPITWETSAALLEKIIQYEAVHDIGGWSDLRRRLHPPDRRCFAFFHPAMPDEPLIFVEIALTRGTPDSVQDILSPDRTPIPAAEADTACFYSISNCQPGLSGISFGNSLIKQVVADLRVALPGLSTFVTLSPVPGLVRWAEAEGLPAPDRGDAVRRLAARYLMRAKTTSGEPRDPVARFHLGNGARLHAIHADADTTSRGRAQSWGAMVNYLYDRPEIAGNHRRFSETGEIAASASVRSLVADADARPPKAEEVR
ncbi:malonyl-CoA decarboxylase [Jannaschia sp. LMIT008]|uniref:malonyl-CoA decarboxylase n=1 Tax=Jannaschia maritima TaxID=3032585 RepID=UPI002810F869|nr:malonyl-CoA decarboxylase [Jannaschia sp. LMIT008]